MPREVEVDLAEPEPVEEVTDQSAQAALAQEHDPPQLSDLAQFLKHTRAILPTAVMGIFILAVVTFLYFAKAFVMPVVIALLLAFLLKPMVTALARIHIPRIIGSVLVITVFFGLLAIVAGRVLQPAAEWAGRAPETLALVQEKFEHILRRAQRLSRAAATVENMTSDSSSQSTRVEVKEPQFVKTMVVYTTSFVAGLIETIVLLFFMLAPGNLYMEKLVRVLPTMSDKKKAVEIASEAHQNLSAFLFTITMINTLLGVCVGLACWAAALPNPALWGVLAGCLNFIPYFGPITGVVILLVVGFVTFDQAWRAILPSFFYLALHSVESNFVTPMILGRRLTLNPLVIFISLMFWTWLWGVPGALLSIPMLMLFKIVCDHFKPLAPVGEFLSG